MYKQQEKNVDNDNVDQLPQSTKCEISRVKGDHWTIIDPYSIFIQDVKKKIKASGQTTPFSIILRACSETHTFDVNLWNRVIITSLFI